MLAGSEQTQDWLYRPGRLKQDRNRLQRFADDDHIRANTFMLAGKELAGPAQTGLDFVGDEENIIAACRFRQRCFR